MEARVRAVLWKHLAGDAQIDDPTSFLPATDFNARLQQHAASHGHDALRKAAHGYVSLWARTFPVLVRHLRGRPEQALALFCDEVYPYLRGQARAARLETHEPGKARVVLAADLDPMYLAGLLEAFVGISGADVQARPLGAERFEVRFRIAPSDRFDRAIQYISRIRAPLLVTAAFAVLLGAAMAGSVNTLSLSVVMAGSLGAQFAANALHDLRFPRLRGPLDPGPSPVSATGQMIVGYGLAGASAALLVWGGRTWILAFAAIGALLSLTYPLVRDQGLGPLMAGIIHGPLMVLGSLYAFTGGLPDGGWAFLASLPLGALVAAILFVDDLADRPLDEAGGKRTMAVRLPRRIHAAGYGALLLAASAAAAGYASRFRTEFAIAVIVLGAVGTLLLTRRVAIERQDPRALAPARLGTFVFHVVLTTALLTTILIP